MADNFGPVELGDHFSVIWNSTDVTTNALYIVQKVGKSNLVTTASDENESSRIRIMVISLPLIQ